MRKTTSKILTTAFLAFTLMMSSCGQVQKFAINVVNGTGGGSYESGKIVTITATVPEYKDFDYWSSNDIKVSEANPYTFTVTKDATYTAIFKAQQATLTVTNGTGGGTYDKGTSVTITANTAPQYQEFDYWSRNGTKVEGSTNPYTFKLTEDASYTAVYKTQTATISVTNGTGGGTYNVGASATITANDPQQGYEFTCWKSDGQVVSSSSSYTFTVTKSASFIAEYTKVVADITVVNGTGGGTYNVGASVTITADAAPEYQDFDYWKCDGVKVSTDNPYTFTASKDATYTAVYKAQTCTLTVKHGTGGGTYAKNSSATVTATPGSSQTFNHWEIDGEPVSTENPYTFTILEDTTITAVMDGASDMEKYTRTVYKKNPTYKVLNLTDLQFTNNDDLTETKHIIDSLVESENPDLITVLGDVLNDSKTYDCDQSSKNILDYINEKDIPWAPIFGNHDTKDYKTPYVTKKSVGIPYLMDLFKGYDNCLFIEGPNDVLGKSNYLVNIVDQESGDLVESLVFLDSSTNGLDATSVKFYEDATEYATELNDGEAVKTVVFSHIPNKEYLDEYTRVLAEECHDVVGVLVQEPLATTGDTLFASMKTHGKTKTMICGHDHENQYYTVKDGIKLAYAMKSSDGDNDSADYIHKHPLGGLLLTVDGVNEDKLDYRGVTDIGFTVKSGGGYDFHPQGLSYFQYSGAKFAFDVEFPSSGTIQFNVQGTNLLRTDLKYKERVGSWNRLTGNVDLVAGTTPTADYGTLTPIEGNKYHYEVDLSTLKLNTGTEAAYGDETARLIYFHNASGDFKFTNLHYEFEEITETDQIDLSNAVIGSIESQLTKGVNVPVKPSPTVTLNGSTLKLKDDILLTYKDNTHAGTATLTVVPSGKGAHKYKGSVSTTFEIEENIYRGSEFKAGNNINLDLDVPYALTDVFTVDLFFKSGSDTHINCMLGDGWDNFFGYYKITPDSKTGDYTGVTITKLSDGYTRIEFDISKLNNVRGTLSEIEEINLFHIRGNWTTASGYYEVNPKDTSFTMTGSEFKICNFTDIHVDNTSYLEDSGTVGKTIKYAVANSNPDMMIFSGDIAGSSSDLKYLIPYIDSFKIPYFFIMGNHDHEGSLGFDTIASYLNSSRYGYVGVGPSYLEHIGNYTIKINNSQGELVHSLVMMNSGNKTSVSDASKIETVSNQISGVKYGSYDGQTTYCDSTSSGKQIWDGIRGSQIEWYEETVDALGCDTTLFVHAPMLEYVKAFEQYQDAVNKKDQTAIAAFAPIGQCNMGEQSCGSLQNFGLFDTILKHNSTKNVICGHDHLNDFSLLYQGVRLTYALKTGSGAYWKDGGSRSGYTTLTIDSTGGTTLNQVYFNPLA